MFATTNLFRPLIFPPFGKSPFCTTPALSGCEVLKALVYCSGEMIDAETSNFELNTVSKLGMTQVPFTILKTQNSTRF